MAQHGGPRANSGGARPGAGRKAPETKIAQAVRRAAFETEVSEQDWLEIIRTAVRQAKQGDIAARAWLTPYVAGKVPDEITVAGALTIEVEYSDTAQHHQALPAAAASRAATGQG